MATPALTSSPDAFADARTLAVVQVQGRPVGIDVRHVVQAIEVPAHMAAVPRRAGGIAGVVEHGRQLVPVVDIARWLAPDDAEPAAAPASAEARVVVLSHDGQVVGLRVEAVVGLRRCGAGDVARLFHDERPDELFAHAARGEDGGAPLVLLAPERLAALAGAWCAAAEIAVGAIASDADGGAAAALVATASVGVFRIGDAMVGLPVDAIGELMPVPSLRPPPFRHPAARGLCDWRGRLLPVVDLTTALGALADPSAPAWMCVVRHGELALGVLVHEIHGLQTLPVDAEGEVDAAPRLVRHEVVTERGIVFVVDTGALMATCPEATLSLRRQPEAVARRDAGGTRPYMVFEAAGTFASAVDGVQEVVPLPAALRARLDAGLAVSLSWRGHAVPVRDVLSVPGDGGSLREARQLVVVVVGTRRMAVPIRGVKAMIAPNAASVSRLQLGGREVGVVSTATSEGRESHVLVDLVALLDAAVDQAPTLRQVA